MCIISKFWTNYGLVFGVMFGKFENTKFYRLSRKIYPKLGRKIARFRRDVGTWKILSRSILAALSGWRGRGEECWFLEKNGREFYDKGVVGRKDNATFFRLFFFLFSTCSPVSTGDLCSSSFGWHSFSDLQLFVVRPRVDLFRELRPYLAKMSTFLRARTVFALRVSILAWIRRACSRWPLVFRHPSEKGTFSKNEAGVSKCGRRCKLINRKFPKNF